jgi:hypothetical protein
MTPAPPPPCPVLSWAAFVALYAADPPTLPWCVPEHAGTLVFVPLEATVVALSAVLRHYGLAQRTPSVRLCFVSDAPVTALAPWYRAINDEETA